MRNDGSVVLTTKHSARIKPGLSRDGKAECSKYTKRLQGMGTEEGNRDGKHAIRQMEVLGS